MKAFHISQQPDYRFQNGFSNRKSHDENVPKHHMDARADLRVL